MDVQRRIGHAEDVRRRGRAGVLGPDGREDGQGERAEAEDEFPRGGGKHAPFLAADGREPKQFHGGQPVNPAGPPRKNWVATATDTCSDRLSVTPRQSLHPPTVPMNTAFLSLQQTLRRSAPACAL